ncbi:MAG: LysE family transporter [Alphaproteobacteria bacterium]|nr:LysE family transporter [Alphaproteobacteria bacterium]
MILFLSALKGLLLMASVIVAIGPQNAFLLRQAVRREQAWRVAAIFLFGDVTMVALGGFGIGHWLECWPLAKLLLTAAGAVYIFWFGFGVLRQMRQPKALTAGGKPAQGLIAGALAVTFLNPHAIFDTVVLIGTMALQFEGPSKIAFMLGAMTASMLWFFGVAWAGQKLAPFLARPDVWRVIDGLIVAVMFVLSLTLAGQAVRQGLALAGS